MNNRQAHHHPNCWRVNHTKTEKTHQNLNENMKFIKISRKFDKIEAHTEKERGLKTTYEKKQSIRNTGKGKETIGIGHQNVNETQK